MEIEFDVKITTAALYDYMLRHTYTSLQGVIGTAFGAFSILFYCIDKNPLYLAIAAVILLYLPVTLYLRAKTQALSTPAFKAPLHYRLDEKGVTVSQGETTQTQAWDKVVKAVSTKNSIIVYTSKVNASIFPRKDLGGKQNDVIRTICAYMPPAKVKIRY